MNSPISRALDAYSGPMYWIPEEGKIGMHPDLVKALLAATDEMYKILEITD